MKKLLGIVVLGLLFSAIEAKAVIADLVVKVSSSSLLAENDTGSW